MRTYTIECTRSNDAVDSIPGLQCRAASSKAVFEAPSNDAAFQVAQLFCAIRGVWSIRVKTEKHWLPEVRRYDNRGITETDT